MHYIIDEICSISELPNKTKHRWSLNHLFAITREGVTKIASSNNKCEQSCLTNIINNLAPGVFFYHSFTLYVCKLNSMVVPCQPAWCYEETQIEKGQQAMYSIICELCRISRVAS